MSNEIVLACVQAFFGNGLMVFLMGIQMKFVIDKLYRAAFFTSCSIGTCQLMGLYAVLGGSPHVLSMVSSVLGGGVGIVGAIHFHQFVIPLLMRLVTRAKQDGDCAS